MRLLVPIALAFALGCTEPSTGSGTPSDPDSLELTIEPAEPFEERAPVDPDRVRYGEIQVETMNAQNRITILVAASNVDGVARSQLAPERLVVRVSYDDSRTHAQAIAAAIGAAGFEAGVLRHSMPVPDDFQLP